MLPKFETQSNTALGADTRKNAYNVFSFGVHPDHQNKGIGKALLNVILERVRHFNVWIMSIDAAYFTLGVC